MNLIYCPIFKYDLIKDNNNIYNQVNLDIFILKSYKIIYN